MNKKLIIGLILILLVPLVSGADWDNIKSYDPETKTITIYNYNIIGQIFDIKLAEYKLISNTDQCLTDCEAVGKTITYQEEKLFSNMEFEDEEGNSKSLLYNIYLLETKENVEEQDTFEYKCTEYLDNASKPQESCENVKNGTQEIIIYTNQWNKYNGELLPTGEYTWRITAKKGILENIDWIGSAFGERFTEWAWWNSNWNKKKQIVFTENNNTNVLNYSINITVVYDSDMNADYSDLRFLDTSESTEIPYWIMNTSTTKAKVWIRIPSLSASGTTNIYMYYNNSGASTTSLINDTFLFGDDFESYKNNTDMNGHGGWLRGGGGSTTTISATANTPDRAKSLILDVSTIRTYLKQSVSFNDTGVHIGYRQSIDLLANSGGMYLSEDSYSAGGQPNTYGYEYYHYEGTFHYIRQWVDGSQTEISDQPDRSVTGTLDIWRDIDTYLIGNITKTFINRTEEGTYLLHNSTEAGIDRNLPKFAFWKYNGIVAIDYVYIRSFVEQEPTHSIGAEEEINAVPSVQLQIPLNNTNQYYKTVNFTYNVTDIDGDTISNCTLWLEKAGVWELNKTDTSITPTINQTFNLTMNYENVNWTVGCYDDQNNQGNSTKYNLTIQTPQVVVTLQSPSNNTNFSYTGINLTYQASEVGGVVSSCNLSINGVLNETDTSITESTDQFFNKTFADGNYLWKVQCNDTANNIGTSAERNFTIDTTNPSLTLVSPTSNQQLVRLSLPTNITLNYTVTDSNLGSCYYNTSDSSTQNIFTCNSITNVSFTTNGTKTIWYYVNDTVGNENYSSVSFLINYIMISINYSTIVYEGQTQAINLTMGADYITQLNGTLVWQGNKSSTSSSTTHNGTLTNSFTVPSTTLDYSQQFYYGYYLNGIYYNTTNYTQEVRNIGGIQINNTCAVGLSEAFCYDFKDEDNRTILNGTVDYNIQYGVGNASFTTYNGSLNETYNFCICINATNNDAYDIGYGELQYAQTGYTDRRHYIFENQRLTNITINDTLFLLENSKATSFLFSFEGTSLDPFEGKYASLIRWYPDLDTYDTVDMGKTDNKGQTIMRVMTEDVDYRVGLYHTNGSLIKLLSAVRFACLSSPCTYSSIIDLSETDYTSVYGVEGSLTFNNIDTFTFAYNDPSQSTEEITMKVYLEGSTNSPLICTDIATGYTGVVSCNISGYDGTVRAEVYRTASPSLLLANMLRQLSSTVFRSDIGLIIGLIFSLVLALIGISNPALTVIMAVIGLIPAVIFGSLGLGVVISLGALGGIIIHFMKRVS